MNFPSAFKRPAVVWTALTAVLIVLAMMIPVEWVQKVGDTLGDAPQVTDAFSDSVGRVDQALAAGEDPGVSDAELRKMLPHLQVRRLMRTGPMTHDDVVEATALLREFNHQIATQELEGSRQALRHERNRRLAEALPRLDADEIGPTLAQLRRELTRVGLAGS